MKINKTPVIISIVMLFLAIPPIFPYGYYMLLRLIVCGTSVYVALKAKEANKEGWMWGVGFVAVLFNPLIPVHLNKGLWSIIDLVVAIVFCILVAKLHKE